MKRKYLFYFLIIIISIGLIGTVVCFYHSDKDKKIPSISIGCDRLLWNKEKLEIKPSLKNIENPKYEWTIDNKFASNNEILITNLDSGKHKISLNIDFDNNKMIDNMTVIVINSIEGITLKDFQFKDSKNQWKFQIQYNKEDIGLKNVYIYIDSLPKVSSNNCGEILTQSLFAGNHSWKAEYRGNIIKTGNFYLKEVNDVKIAEIKINSKYKTGDTVSGKIVLTNTGTNIINKFDLKTVAINKKFEFMGDNAKREYYDKYENLNLKPGDEYEITVKIKIPDKVKGIRPTGKYSININAILDNKTINNKTANIEVI